MKRTLPAVLPVAARDDLVVGIQPPPPSACIR